MFIPIYGLTRAQVPKSLIRHSNIFKSIWDSIILVCILYTSAMVPFLVTFKFTAFIIVVFDTLVDAMFLIDIMLTFFTTYVDNGEIIINRKLIRRNYLRGWFTLDCIAALPYSVINFIMGDKVSGSSRAEIIVTCFRFISTHSTFSLTVENKNCETILVSRTKGVSHF